MMPSVPLPAAPLPAGVQKQAGRLDIHSMFQEFNAQYFDKSLHGVYVEYSKKMTRCAGTCTFLGPHGGCRIALSEPLLSLRPPEDTVATLLHEAIHASLFLKFGVERDSSDGHGPRFLAEAERISKASGVQITVFHDFTDEVGAYLRHWWRCNGCGLRIKRAMNRAPAPLDNWWPEHAKRCRGKFEKTHEPPPPPKPPKHGVVAVAAAASPAEAPDVEENIFSFSDAKPLKKKPVRVHRIDEMMQSRVGAGTQAQASFAPSASKPPLKRKRMAKLGRFSCPACNQGGFLTEGAVSAHLDRCLAGVSLSQAEPGPETPKQSGDPPRSSRRAVQEDDVVVIVDDDDAAARASKPGPFPNASEFPTRRERPKPDSEDIADVQCVKGRHDAAARKSEIAPSPPRSTALDTREKDVMSVGGARASLPWEMSYGQDSDSPCILDVALGIGEYAGILDAFSGLSQLVHRKEGVGETGSDSLPKIPPLPCDVEKPDHMQLMRQLKSRIGLWEPNNDIFEAPFAASAARHGLTPREFMANLVRDGTENRDGLVLSERGKQLFIQGGVEEAQHARNRSVIGSLSKNGGTTGSELKRPRRELDSPVAVDVPSHPSARGSKLTKATQGGSPRSSLTGVSGSIRNGSKKKSQGGIDSFFKSKASVPPVRARAVRDAAEPTPPIVAPAPIVVEDKCKDTMKCPICDAIVTNDVLSTHLEACVGVEDSDSDTGNDNTKDTGAVLDTMDCPICSERVPRLELERHTQTCMASFGLDAAFD